MGSALRIADLFQVNGQRFQVAAFDFRRQACAGIGFATIDAPFATVKKAHDNEALQPGDVIYLRGGTYYPTNQTGFNKVGNANNYFVLSRYPGEVPVIDGTNIPEGDIDSTSTPTWAFINAGYWKVRSR